ncbi:MAG: GvpL/GvpF family gas vesicle protein [bacterium]|nr:GvpL/GvpF family gas vesicle protein [bacterium]
MCLIYTYCIAMGIKGNELSTKNLAVSKINHIEILLFKDIQAVISIVDYEEFNENKIKEQLNKLEWVEEKAFAHENIIEEIMENYPVVPMQFCTIYKSEESLLDFLEDYYDQIKYYLSLAATNQEWGVKVYCNTDMLKERILEKQTFRDELNSINKKSTGIAFMLNKKFQEKIDNCIQDTINVDVQHIFEEVNTTLENVIIKEIQNSDFVEKRIVLNIVALLGRNKYENFTKIIDALSDKYNNYGYAIETNGPWPIYNFISFTVKT